MCVSVCVRSRAVRRKMDTRKLVLLEFGVERGDTNMLSLRSLSCIRGVWVHVTARHRSLKFKREDIAHHLT